MAEDIIYETEIIPAHRGLVARSVIVVKREETPRFLVQTVNAADGARYGTNYLLDGERAIDLAIERFKQLRATLPNHHV